MVLDIYNVVVSWNKVLFDNVVWFLGVFIYGVGDVFNLIVD